MRTGEPVSAAPGRTTDKVYDLDAQFVMGSLRAEVEPHPNYRSRNYALFVNGLWRKNELVPSNQETIEICHPIDYGSSSTATFAVVEVGDHESFDDDYYVPGGWVKEEEASDAARIRIRWTAGFLVDESYGDGSLASVTLTGALRNVNTQPDDNYPSTRARLYYTIQDTGSAYLVRLYSNDSLVASGSRVGDGLVTLTANNSSGLTGQAILTYSADVEPGSAYLLLRWPAAYYLHYSTSSLSYPRTPEMVVYDQGVTNYVALTPILSAGSYYYSVQALGDDGVEQDPVTTPTDSPKVIKNPPLPGTITGATGNATTGITVSWTPGEPWCSWMLYYSLVDEPVNFGQWPLPMPIARPVGASSAVLGPIVNYAPLDRTSAWTTYLQSIDDVVANMVAAWDAGHTGFATMLATQRALALAALQTLSNATGIPTPEHQSRYALQFDLISDSDTYAPTDSVAIWQSYMYQPFSQFLSELSLATVGWFGRYTFTDGSLPFSGTGTADSTYGPVVSVARVSVQDLVTPLVTNRKVRCVLRATRTTDSLQEVYDDVYVIELDANGDVVLPRPNEAWISSLSGNGLTTTFTIQYRTDDQAVAPSAFDVYAVKDPGAINYASAQGTVSAGSAVTGLITATVSVTVASAGYYHIAAKARSAAGVRSANAVEKVVWIGTESPAGPTGIGASVIRSLPLQELEDN